MFMKSIKIAVSVLALLGAAACTNTSAPNMVDYSYVPPTKMITPISTPGIEEF